MFHLHRDQRRVPMMTIWELNEIRRVELRRVEAVPIAGPHQNLALTLIGIQLKFSKQKKAFS